MSDENEVQDDKAATLAVGFGEASADNPPFPAQQHLDVTDDLGGDGTDEEVAAHADDYEYLDGVPEQGDDPYGTGATEAVQLDNSNGDGGDDTEPDYDSSVAKIEAWVEAHPEDAQRYLDAEQAKSKPRSSLVESLEATVAAE